jgi:hypothetical protein
MTSVAAGTLIVIGAILTALGVFAGGSIAWAAIGLLAIAAGGVLGLADRRR